MADFTPVALGVKPPQGMSLSEMLNMANVAQQYQQAQQLNPLALQKAQMEVQQLEKMNPLTVRKATAEASTAETGSEKSKFDLERNYAEKARGVFGGYANDPDFISGNGPAMVKKLEAGQAFLKSINVPSHPNGTTAQLIEMAKTDPKAVRQQIANMTQGELGAAGQQALQSGAIVEINGVKYQYNPATKQATPLGEGNTPVAPAAPAVPNASAAPNVPANTPQVKPSTSGLVVMDMPVTGNIPQLNQQQQDRYAYGKKLLDSSAEMAQAAGEGRQTIRQIQQNIGEAAGSKPEQVLRNAKKWAVGNEQLDELVKSLADNQLRQAQMMGVNTDAARSTSSLASGSENITAGALKMITNRADAVNTAFEKFNQGLNTFKQKNGQYNGAIHADNFQQAWKANYDPLVFMVQNINASDMSKAEKQLELTKMMKGLSEQQRQALAKKAENIKRLEKGDF